MERIRRGLEAVLGAVVDVLVDDACHACLRRHRGGAEGLDPVRGAVTRPVRVGPLVNHPVCPRCARRLAIAPGPARIVSPAGNTLRVVTPFLTGPMLLDLIHRLKFARVTSLAVGLSSALERVAAPVAGVLRDPVLVPVPMDPKSLRRRGFNQSEVIAAHLARAWGMDIAAALEKPRETAPQSLARADRRLANVAGAFRADAAPILARDVVLVDDLVTTGATAGVAAAVLESGGAASVTVAAIGRTA